MSRHANISIFVPHYGCPNRCSFCNQNAITGKREMPSADDVRRAVEKAVSSGFGGAQSCEIAFFGGSFTAIDRKKMLELLGAAYPFVKDGTVSGIRISTRPDFIDDEILDILESYGVSTIELGAQSMDDGVLTLNSRGHSSGQVVLASRMIKARGFELGLQMMTGLMGDSDEVAIATAEKLAALNPDTMRIYPLIILKNTYLETAFKDGSFRPQTLDEAVALCCRLLLFFHEKKIPVIRLGLHELEESQVVAGPWHPAFSELCTGRLYYKIISEKLDRMSRGEYTVSVAKGETSKAVGHKKCNSAAWEQAGKRVKIREKEGLLPLEFEINREG